MIANISLGLVVFGFLIPIGYKMCFKQSIQIKDIKNCVLSAMVLPTLAYFAYFAFADPDKVMEHPDVLKLLMIAILVIGFLSILNITDALRKKNNSP